MSDEPTDNSNLPEGVKLDMDYSADKFFDEGKEPAAAPAAPTPPPVTPPVAAAPTPTPPPAGSLAAKLAAKNAPAPAPAAPTPPPVLEDPVAKIEAEMKAHNPKWKPAQGWDQLKTTLKTEAEKRSQLEKEVNELREKANKAPVLSGMTSDELESLKAREKAASDRLMILDLENHPSYRAQFTEPKNAELGRAKELLEAHGVKADVASLLGKPRAELGKAVSELVKDIPEFDRVEVAEALRKAYTLEQNGKAALGQSKDLLKGLQAQTVEKQRAAFANRWAPVSAALKEHIVELEVAADASPEEKASIEGYNAGITGLRAKAEQIAFAPATEESVAEAAMKAAAYEFHVQTVMPRILREYETVVNLNRQMADELKALKGRNPNHSIKPSPGASDPGGPKHLHEMDHAEAAEAIASGNYKR